MEKLFKIIINLWSSTFYLNYSYLIENNQKQINIDLTAKILEEVGKLDENADDYYDEISDISDYLVTHCNFNEIYLTKILNRNLTINKNSKFIVGKVSTKLNFNNLEPNRWMSFSKLVTLNKSDFEGFGNTLYSFVLPLNFKYVDCKEYGDEDEILINSNEIIKYIKKLKITETKIT